MRNLIFGTILLTLATSLSAAGWVDNQNGSWSAVTQSCGTITVTTAVKAKLEKCRASDNFRFRWSNDAMDASMWLDGIKNGFADTRHNGATVRHPGIPIPSNANQNWWRSLWRQFLQRYVWNNHPTQDAAGLAISVDSPLPRP